MSNQIVPTAVLQSVVDYLGSRPYTEVKTVLENLLEHSKPEDTKVQMKDPFFRDSELVDDQETK